MDTEPVVDLSNYSSLPRFEDGSIDYTNADHAPVLMCFVQHLGKILLLKRKNGRWDVITGYIDRPQPLKEKALDGLAEDLGLEENQIKRFVFVAPYDYVDAATGKTWTSYPALSEVKKKPEIPLDGEYTEAVWIRPSEVVEYMTVPGLEATLLKILS